MKKLVSIALVEDETDLRNCMQEYLTLAGFYVWSVRSAEEFYRRFSSEPADIVILDIGLPGENGLSVSLQLKINNNVNIILLSAHNTAEDRISGLRAGADRYLVKPVSMAELLANIQALVNHIALQSACPMVELPEPSIAPQSGSDVGHERQGHWCLLLQDRSLRAPDGHILKLTAYEFILLHCLIAESGKTIAQKRLIKEIFGAHIQNSPQRLIVLIARMRKKSAQVLGQELPLKTNHQIGYTFIGSVFIEFPPKFSLPRVT